jgi:hypothetical protein
MGALVAWSSSAAPGHSIPRAKPNQQPSNETTPLINALFKHHFCNFVMMLGCGISSGSLREDASKIRVSCSYPCIPVETT